MAESANEIDVGNVTTYTLDGLTNGNRYEVWLVAYNDTGESPAGDPSVVVPRTAPTPKGNGPIHAGLNLGLGGE